MIKDNRLQESKNALLASELRYRRVFEAAKDGILILNADTGVIVDVNPFLINLLGYSRDEFIDKAIWDIGLFKDIFANKQNFITLKETKYIRYEDKPLESADGHKVDVEFVSNVYEEDSQNVIQCNIRDITERKRNADLVGAEREKLAVTLRSIGDGVIATDGNGNIEIMNIIAEDLCGWTQKEAFGKPLATVFKVLNENTREQNENLVDKVLATGEIINLENHTLIISKSGTERIIAKSAAPIRNKTNEITGVVLVFRDITEKTKLIENWQRAQKLESLGLLAGGIAHDFNNLMGGIFGYIDLAIEACKEDKVKHYLSNAINAMERARGLTHQLLTFAKGGAPVLSKTSMIQIIQETTKFALSGSNVSCECHIAEDLWYCVIDKNQICQVIDNIVINAQQAMPLGGNVLVSASNISLSNKEHSVLCEGIYVKISIADSGLGISKKLLPRIFDPFFSTKEKGHGLGLSTCYSIVSRHKGIIDVVSVIDEGTTFHIYLPATREESFQKAKIDITHKGTGTIILMDDEQLMLDTIGTMLKSFGYEILCAKDGKEALAFFEMNIKNKGIVAGMILDLTVPGGMGGKDVVDNIRNFNTVIPVFAASGYSEDDIIKSPEEYGFTASISKPFRISELAGMLEKYIKKSI